MSKLFWILVGMVMLAPLPFGSRQVWAWGLMATVVAALMSAWAARLAMAGRAPAIGLDRLWPAVVPFLLAMLWVAVQISQLTPADWHHPLWYSAGKSLGTALPSAVSVNPYDSASGLVRLLTFAGIFWLSVQFCGNAIRASQVFHCIAIAGLVYAAYGLIAEFSGTEKILWYDKLYYRGSVTSTLEYKNAYATYAGLGLICAIGLIIQSVDDASRNVMGSRERLRRVLSRVIEDGWALVLTCVVLMTALLLSNSRGGFFAVMAGLFALLAAMAYARRGQFPYFRNLAVIILVGGLGFAMYSGDRIFDRLDQLNPEKDVRTLIYDRTGDAIADTPWLGTGFRTFGDTFAIYRTPDIWETVLRAHNTYLDNALGLGIPAAILLTASVAALGALCVPGLWRRRRNVIYPCMGIAATILVGVHALFDFTLQMPAVSATYCLLMGAACAQSWSSRENRTNPAPRPSPRGAAKTAAG